MNVDWFIYRFVIRFQGDPVLTLSDLHPTHDCQGLSRREFLRIGALGTGGLSLAGLLGAKAAGAGPASVLKDRAVVLLFLQGGPPHIEFFDPKMTAPSEIRCVTGETQTKLPGITFGATFPKLAALADRLAVIRSYGSANTEHRYGSVVSGGDHSGPAMSAVYARIRGSNHHETGFPTNVLVLPEAISRPPRSPPSHRVEHWGRRTPPLIPAAVAI
jgi:hypothetical protein